MDKQTIQEEYKQQIPALLNKILLMWKDAPSSYSWVMEKLMEVFCRDIAHDMELVKAVGFISFVNGFFEDGHLIQYPDFVMNNVSLMAAEVLLSGSEDASLLEDQAFEIIRSPLHFWMVTKGHRVDTTFQIYKKFLQQRRMLHLLDKIEFDVSQALAHGLLSTHNYTRKSACDYFIELVKFAFNQHSEACEDEGHSMDKIKAKLKKAISQHISQFNTELKTCANAGIATEDKENCAKQTDPLTCDLSAVVNYCRLLSDCAATCEGWSQVYSQTDLFDVVIQLLQVVVSDQSVDQTDLYSDTQKELKQENLLQLLVQVCEKQEYHMTCDAVYMAGALLNQAHFRDDNHFLLFELSLLPLFVLFEVTPQHVLKICPSSVVSIQTALRAEQSSKPSGLMQEAILNLHTITDNKISGCHNDFLDYLTLKRMDLPEEVGQSVLNGDRIKSDKFLNFLVLQFSRITPLLDRGSEKCLLDCVQIYTRSCLNFPGISHMQLTAVMDCYIAVLKCLTQIASEKQAYAAIVQDTDCICSAPVLKSVLLGLQLKMVDIDANIRELAVKATGELYMTGCPEMCATMEMSQSLRSLWQCVEDKIEGVAMNVLDFIWMAAKADKLDNLMQWMKVTKEDMRARVKHFLLSRPWDNIKLVAFHLLTKLCADDMLVQYAEVCLNQDNARLALAVLEYIQGLFSANWQGSGSLEPRINRIMGLLTQGWADLMLNKANAIDTCSFRAVASVMKSLLLFMKQPNVSQIVHGKVIEFAKQVEKIHSRQSERVHECFKSMCEEIIEMHGWLGSVKLKRTECTHNTDNEPVSVSGVNSDLDSDQQAVLKRKCTDSKDTHADAPVEKKHCLDSEEENVYVDKNDDKSTSAFDAYFLCSLISEEATSHRQNKVLNCQGGIAASTSTLDCDTQLYLDSTKELPPLTLSTQSFPSQMLIKASLAYSQTTSDPATLKTATDLLTWFTFQEMLERIDPDTLREEAQRSTDEYERNTLLLLHDVDQVLNRTFHNLREQFRDELVYHFFNRLSSFLALAGKAIGSQLQSNVLKGLTSLLYLMMQVLKNEDDLIKFVLHKRWSILKAPLQPNREKFTLDQFLERLHEIKQCGYSTVAVSEHFSSVEGLGLLLDLYPEKNFSDVQSISESHSSKEGITLEGSSHVSDSLKGETGDCKMSESINQVISLLQDQCCNLNKSSATEFLMSLKGEEINCLHSVLAEGVESQERIQECLKDLLNSDKHEKFQEVVCILQNLTKELILFVFDGGENRMERYSTVGTTFGQLENWFGSDSDGFDSEGDNDPTALDCF